jgi:hypothetical protein
MEIYEYDYDGVKLDIHYETEDGDASVGLFGTQIFILGIYHKGDDIYELLSESTIKFLESELGEYVHG